MAVTALPDVTPVVISGSWDGTVRVWRLVDGIPVGNPLTGHDGAVDAVAAGALPDGTPVVISGSRDGTVRVWRLADGTPVGEPLTGHRARSRRALPDGTRSSSAATTARCGGGWRHPGRRAADQAATTG